MDTTTLYSVPLFQTENPASKNSQQLEYLREQMQQTQSMLRQLQDQMVAIGSLVQSNKMLQIDDENKYNYSLEYKTPVKSCEQEIVHQPTSESTSLPTTQPQIEKQFAPTISRPEEQSVPPTTQPVEKQSVSIPVLTPVIENIEDEEEQVYLFDHKDDEPTIY